MRTAARWFHRRMFRISDFSRLTRVSIKTLRHYDRLGLLAPAAVDPITRYRHYAAGQVARLQRILALRELGFPLAEIARLVEERPSSRRLRAVLAAQRAGLALELEVARRRLAQLDARLSELRDPRRSSFEVVIQAVPAVRVASRRARVAELDRGAEALFERVEADAASARVRAPGPPILIYHDRDHRETDADVEAAVPVAAGARSAGGARVRDLPAIAQAGCIVYQGDYRQWRGVVRDLAAWLEARRLEPAGPMREVFLRFAATDPQALRLPRQYLAAAADELVTEVQIPVRGAPRTRRRTGIAAKPRSRGSARAIDGFARRDRNRMR